MLVARILSHLFICFISMKTIALATLQVDEHDDSTRCGPNRALLALNKKAKEMKEKGFYAEAIEELEIIFSLSEKKTQRRVLLPREPQFSKIIAQMSTPDFAEHARTLLSYTEKTLTPLELLSQVEKVISSYVNHFCNANPHIKQLSLNNSVFIIYASLAGALLKASKVEEIAETIWEDSLTVTTNKIRSMTLSDVITGSLMSRDTECLPLSDSNSYSSDKMSD